MVQSKLKSINIHDLLTINIDSKIQTGQVTRILATYMGNLPDDTQHTADVDFVSIEQLKTGDASIEVNNCSWIPYYSIIQKSKQPSIFKFAMGQLKRFCKTNFVYPI